jgi:hypothetical protein
VASPAKIIERIRAHGANVMIDGGRLEIINKAKLPAGSADYIRQNAKAIAAFLDREAEFEERAAIMEYNGGLRRADAEYLTKLLMANPPEGIDPADWTYLVSEGAKIAERGLAA